jgi:hypothetical protein
MALERDVSDAERRAAWDRYYGKLAAAELRGMTVAAGTAVVLRGAAAGADIMLANRDQRFAVGMDNTKTVGSAIEAERNRVLTWIRWMRDQEHFSCCTESAVELQHNIMRGHWPKE